MIRMWKEFRKTRTKWQTLKEIKQVLYIKWKLGQCRHLCDCCCWWYECYANYEEYNSTMRYK